MMITFDEILPTLEKVFLSHGAEVGTLRPILVNRDLNGRVRLVVDEKHEDNQALKDIAQQIQAELGPHAYPADQAVLFEPDFTNFLAAEVTFPLAGVEGVRVIDRLATEGNWSDVLTSNTSAPRIVFYSIKGGVGRSTALAATAWALAEQGKRVLVLDLDLESPGLSSSLLPEDRRPTYGIVDWLVEDLVDNGAPIFESMVAASALSHNGEIFVVPAHGLDSGEYIAKLGRVWMPKANASGVREPWFMRLRRLLDSLEAKWLPDVTLIDSRAGIDEVASACITALSASTILLFAIDGDQTWDGYRTLFRHWRKTEATQGIREHLQVVGAMLPELGTDEYVKGLREKAWDVFAEELYDEVPAGAIPGEEDIWSFDTTDESAPHYPWAVRWHRSFAALRSLHGRLSDISGEEVNAIFGSLVEGVNLSIANVQGEQ